MHLTSSHFEHPASTLSTTHLFTCYCSCAVMLSTSNLNEVDWTGKVPRPGTAQQQVCIFVCALAFAYLCVRWRVHIWTCLLACMSRVHGSATRGARFACVAGEGEGHASVH